MPGVLSPADRQALVDLAASYATAVDDRDFERLRAVFVPDAVLVTPLGERHGIDRIVEVMAGLRRYEATVHRLGQQTIEAVDDDGCDALTYCEAHHLVAGDEQRTDHVMHIRYHDRFVRTAAGWRISARRLAVAWTDDRPVT